MQKKGDIITEETEKNFSELSQMMLQIMISKAKYSSDEIDVFNKMLEAMISKLTYSSDEIEALIKMKKNIKSIPFKQGLKRFINPIFWKHKIIKMLDVVYNKLSEFHLSIRSFFITAGVISLFLFLIFSFYSDVKTDSLYIEPFEVPESLKQSGHSGRVIANKLMDKINFISQTAKTAKDRRQYIGEWDKKNTNIEVSGTKFSLSSFASRAKKILGFSENKILGEVTLLDGESNNLKLTIRANKKNAITIKGKLSNLDDVLLQAAKYVYMMTDPFILAAYQYETNKNDLEATCLKTIKNIINKNENDVHWAYNLWGVILAKQEKFDLAIKKFEMAVKADSKYPQAYLNWGHALQSMNKYSEAIAKYKKTYKIDKNFVYGYFHMGRVRHAQKFPRAAIYWYKKAIDNDKNYVPAYIYCGIAFKDIKLYNEATKIYQSALEINPSYYQIYMYYGNLLYIQKEYKKTIDMYNKVIEINSRHADAYRGKAWILATCSNAIYRDGAKAVMLAKKALEFNPNINSLDTLAAAYAEAGDFELAIKTQEDVIDILKKGGKTKKEIVESTEHLNCYKNHKPWREK